MDAQTWTDADFDRLSWHDVAVHALRVVEGEHGTGQLLLDLDYILEWRCSEADATTFLLAPATLAFTGVTELRITLDYATATAALVPFTLDRIVRREEARERYRATLWELVVSWPAGTITFAASGFTQRLRGPGIVSREQSLRPGERGDGI